MSKSKLKKVTIDPQVNDTQTAEIARQTLCHQSSTDKPKESSYRAGKKQLHIEAKKGEAFDTCATIKNDYICCNVKVLKSVSNCPYDCSYCFLQNYLNNGTMSVIGNTDSLMQEVKNKQNEQPWRVFRIGTWELGDSLALENVTGQGRQLIEAFAELKNAVLELKTKSDCVDNILSATHNKKTVVSWSMNSEYIINTQEHKTATLEKRLNAIEKVANAGYLTGFHFDPMIAHENWEEGYATVIKEIIKRVPQENIAWISVGSLRFNPEMKHKIQENFPASDITHAQMHLTSDGKVRYVKPLRLQMYEHMYTTFLEALDLKTLSPLSEPEAKKPIFYFCMERWDIWDKIIGEHPKDIGELDYLFAKHIYHKYPWISDQKPNQDLYQIHQST